MNVRFQADADFNHTIVAGILRRFPEVDFRTARQAGLEGVPASSLLPKRSPLDGSLMTWA